MKFNELGRSMVEMLGVLAIIGVLSVGALSGYNKAMFKYKLNKQAESISILLNNSLQIVNEIDSGDTVDANGAIYYTSILKKLNMIPDGITYKSNSAVFKDMFNNDVWIYSSKNNNGMGLRFEPSAQGKEICYNVVNAIKSNSNDLYTVFTQKKYTNDDKYTNEGAVYGDKYCNDANLKCLSHISLNDLDALCNICNEQSCALYVQWK